MKVFIVMLTLLVVTNGSTRALTASAVQVVGTDYNWTIQLGNRYYGVSGNKAVTIPGLRIPNETRIHVGARMYSLFLPFHCVTGIGLGCLFWGSAAVVSIIALRRGRKWINLS